MKISELIKELQDQLDEFGDSDTYCTDTYGFISPITLVYYSVIREDEQGNPLQLGVVVEG